MDKIKNKKKLLIDILSTVFLVLFLFSGWTLFFMREIMSDTKETEMINNDTKIISDSIKSSDKPAEYVKENSYYSMIEDLIKENRILEDSLRYYSTFYKMIKKRYDIEFNSSSKDSGDYVVKTYEMIDKGVRKTPESKLDNDSIRDDAVNDSISSTI